MQTAEVLFLIGITIASAALLLIAAMVFYYKFKLDFSEKLIALQCIVLIIIQLYFNEA